MSACDVFRDLRERFSGVGVLVRGEILTSSVGSAQVICVSSSSFSSGAVDLVGFRYCWLVETELICNNVVDLEGV
jgi:hypothetical protein